MLIDPPLQKRFQPFRIVGSDSQPSAFLEVHVHAVESPQVPSPPAARTQMDAPAIKEGRSTLLDEPYVGIQDASSKERQRSERNQQPVKFITDRQLTERDRKEKHHCAATGQNDLCHFCWSQPCTNEHPDSDHNKQKIERSRLTVVILHCIAVSIQPLFLRKRGSHSELMRRQLSLSSSR